MAAAVMIPMGSPLPYNTRRGSRRASVLSIENLAAALADRRASSDAGAAIERLERRRSSLGLSSLFTADELDLGGIAIADALFGGPAHSLTEVAEPGSPPDPVAGPQAGPGLSMLSAGLKVDRELGVGAPLDREWSPVAADDGTVPGSYDASPEQFAGSDAGSPDAPAPAEPNFTDLFAELRPNAIKPKPVPLHLSIVTTGPGAEPIHTAGVVPTSPSPPPPPSLAQVGPSTPSLKRQRGAGDDEKTPELTTRPGGASSRGVKRPRRRLPESAAVRDAMPKPPRRGRKDPALEAAVAGMAPEAARLEKNRTSAKECRLRKKEYVFNLEQKVIEFEAREAARTKELEIVQAQLRQLQQAYANLSRQAGGVGC